MRASEVLQKCLGDCLGALHALRCRTLLRAVKALLSSRRLTLIDVARAWPGAERVRAPLKAFDRLLSNRHLRDAAHPCAGELRQLAGRHGVRGHGHRRLAAADTIQTQALLGPADRTRSAGQAMADDTRLGMATTPAITSEGCARSNERRRMKTWEYLRVREGD